MKDTLADQIHKRAEETKQQPADSKPVFFRLAHEDDKKLFENLLESNPSIAVHDNFREQKEELQKIKALQNPSSAKEEKQTDSSEDGNIMNEGVWVYYPWLNKIIHLLDEEEFIIVRTNRNQHKITKGEQDLLRQKRIGIIGLSVGQSVATTIALERSCGEIRLADFDTIELNNLNRIKTALYNLGFKKIVQTAREIAEIDPYINIVCYEEGITETNIDDFLTKDGKLDLLIEECDSLDVKIISRIKAKEHGVPVLMETNDRGMIDIERYDLDEEYPLMHNLIGDISWKELGNLTNEQKLPMVMRMAGFKTVSPRQKLTVLELGSSIFTWPQLASNVALGGGVAADVTRRILLNHLHCSGRFYVDVESIISDNKPPVSSYSPIVIEELTLQTMQETATRILATINRESQVHLPIDTIEAIILDAATAPSSGNDQPWKFLHQGNRLFLFHERSRSYSFGDYKNMASYVSLGGVIENVVLSAHKKQLEITVTIFPEKENMVCIAYFDFKETEDHTTETHEWDYLYNNIHERCTNRKVTPNEAAPAEILTELERAAGSIEPVKVSFQTDKSKLRVLGAIISACDRIRMLHPQGHHDFFNREIRTTAEETEAKRTGMDIATLELTPQARMALDLVSQEEIIQVLRNINGLKALKAVSIPNAMNSAAMGLIETDSFTPIDFVKGGRAMQRQWLAATNLGYAYHPMVAPLYLFYRLLFGEGEGLTEEMISELKELRQEFMELFPGKENRGEVLLFRIFKANNIEVRSPRLPVSEIFYTN